MTDRWILPRYYGKPKTGDPVTVTTATQGGVTLATKIEAKKAVS